MSDTQFYRTDTIILKGKEAFNTSFSFMGTSSRQKLNEETSQLDYTVDQMDLADIYRTVHLIAAEYTFFSSAYITFSIIEHILDHKS